MPLGGVFPGGQVSCRACGATLKVPEVFEAVQAPSPTSPYREASALPAAEQPLPPAPPAPAPSRQRRAAGTSCPRCLSRELAAQHDDLVCPRCGGLFVGHARLQSLVDEHRESGLRPVPESAPVSASAPSDAVTYLPCPHCAALMNRKNFGDRSGIVVDVCKTHGVWFDRGELEAVIAFAFDLPEHAEARAALLALVRRALPQTPRPPPAPYEPFPLRRQVRDAESVERLLQWVGRWFA